MSKKAAITISVIVITLILGIIGSVTAKKDSKPEIVRASQSPTPTVTQPRAYKIVYNEDNGSVVNIYALIDPTAIDEATAKQIAFTIQKKECTDISKCNINVFDDSSALQLEHDYNGNTYTPQENEAWARKNYIFVADHYVGNIDFQTPDSFDYYFLKNDSEYQKYK